MKYDFDRIISRKGTYTEKWEPQVLEEKFGTADALPLWVADMDFAVAPPIQEAIAARAAHPYPGPVLEAIYRDIGRLEELEDVNDLFSRL